MNIRNIHKICEKELIVAIVVFSDDPALWRAAIRYAIFHCMQQRDVKVFIARPEGSHEELCAQKPEISAVIKECMRIGGEVYLCGSGRGRLHKLLRQHLFPVLSEKDIDTICYDARFQSMKTEQVYVHCFGRW